MPTYGQGGCEAGRLKAKQVDEALDPMHLRSLEDEGCILLPLWAHLWSDACLQDADAPQLMFLNIHIQYNLGKRGAHLRMQAPVPHLAVPASSA